MTVILETFATLRIFSESMTPDDIEAELGVVADSAYIRDPNARARTKRETNYWSWCTRKRLDSRDNLLHIGTIIAKFSDCKDRLQSLRKKGCRTDLSCYMVTTGQGGPSLDLTTMKSLSELGLEVSWDVYFGDECET